MKLAKRSYLDPQIHAVESCVSEEEMPFCVRCAKGATSHFRVLTLKIPL